MFHLVITKDIFSFIFSSSFHKGDAENPIVNTVLPHDIFKDWVWLLLGKDTK